MPQAFFQNLSKFLRKYGICLLALPITIFLASSAFYYHANHVFLSFTDSVFRNEITSNTLSLHYTLSNPASCGIKDYQPSFGSCAPESLKGSYRMLETYQNTLDKIRRSWLSPKNKLTYDILQLSFQTQKKGESYLLYTEPLGPSLGTQAQLPILLAEYSFSSSQDIEDYLKLLRQLPEYYDSILLLEQEKSDAGLFMNDTMAQGIIDQCSAFLEMQEENILFTTFEERLNSLKTLTEKQKDAYRRQNEDAVKTCVFPAYQNLAKGIQSLMGTGKNDLGLCHYPNGKAYYTYLVQDCTGCYNSIDTILRRIRRQLLSDVENLRLLVEKNPSLLSDSGMEKLQESIADLSGNPESILADLQEKMTEDFPAAPAVSHSVKYVEKAMEDYLSPAFYLTAPLDNLNQNVIYINGKAGYEGLDLYTTLAHEGYPGHLYQTVFSQSSGCNPVRSLLNFSGYVEGWATYIEMLSFSYADVPEETAQLYRINRSLTLGLSSMLDILIHYYGYDRTQTAEVLSQFGFNGTSAVDSFYNLILESPANYLKYYLGSLCFQDLQTAVKKQKGEHFSLKDFHKKILETGPCPFPVLYEQLL